MSSTTITTNASLMTLSGNLEPWHNMEECIGERLCSLGAWHNCWEAIGRAGDISKGVVFTEIKRLLESRHEDLHEGESVHHAITIGIYMIGRTKKRAKPHIMFSCERKPPRTRAVKIVREGEILKEYPGILLGDWRRPPILTRAPELLVGQRSDTQTNIPLMNNIEKMPTLVYWTPRRPINVASGVPISIVKEEYGEIKTYRIATLGGLICVEDELLGLTVAHTFQNPTDIVRSDDIEDIEFLLDFDSSSEEENEENKLVSMTSRGSNSPIQSASDDSGISTKTRDSFVDPMDKLLPIITKKDILAKGSLEAVQKEINHEDQSELGRLLLLSNDDGKANLDWALIRFSDPKQVNIESNRIGSKFIKGVATEPIKSKVAVLTGSNGVLHGTMLGTVTLMQLPPSRAFQEVWTVHIDGPLKHGDCGTWVTNPSTGALYGHIVAGDPAASVAYVVPACQIFSDIGACLGAKVQLPSSRVLASYFKAEPLLTPVEPSDQINKDRRLAGQNNTIPSFSKDDGQTVRQYEPNPLSSWKPTTESSTTQEKTPQTIEPPSMYFGDNSNSQYGSNPYYSVVGNSGSLGLTALKYAEDKLQYDRSGMAQSHGVSYPMRSPETGAYRTSIEGLKPQKYRDKETGKIYTEWKDSRGKIRRKYEQDDRGSSYHAAGSSTRREEQTPCIPRTTPPSYYRQRGSSSVTEPTTTEETYVEYPERGAAYQIHDSSRGTEYYAAVDYDQPQAYPNSESQLSDPSEGTKAIDAGMRNLELDDHYSLGSSLPQTQKIPYGHGSASLQTSQPPSRHIRGTEGQVERLDKTYRVRNTDFKKFFHVGRVFSTLWTEGVGINSARVDQTFISEVIYQERVHSKIRRFVVVKYREGDRSCICLPVTSYDGWGTNKRGITLGDHGFIYSKDKPYTVQGLLPLALKVILSPGSPHLQDRSLVNYRKVYTVETNVKVKDVGHLDRTSMTYLNQNFEYVFFGSTPTDSEDIIPKATGNELMGLGGAAARYTAIPESGSINYPPEDAHFDIPSNPSYYQSSAYPPPKRQTYRVDHRYDQSDDTSVIPGTYQYNDFGPPGVELSYQNPTSSYDDETSTRPTSGSYQYLDSSNQSGNDTYPDFSAPSYHYYGNKDTEQDFDDITLPTLLEASREEESRQRREKKSSRGKGKGKEKAIDSRRKY